MKKHLPLYACLTLALAAAGAHSTGRVSQEAPLDPTFVAPRFTSPSPASGILLLPDGGFLRFFATNTLVEQRTGPVTRHFADGSLNSSFQFSADYAAVGAALRLPDGKFIIAAARSAYGGPMGEELLRIHADGSIDHSFPPVLVHAAQSAIARGLVLQPDGRILVAGSFTQFGTHARPGIVRLLADGTLDTSFAPVPLFASTTGGTIGLLAINEPVLQPDGKIVIYGNFRRIGTTHYTEGVARLNSDGTVDGSFFPTGFTRVGAIRTADLQSDGKILIGGRFSVSASFAANPTGSTYSNLPFVRLHPNGSADQSYGYFNTSASIFHMRDSVVQSDNKVVGTSTSVGAASVFRFDANGTLDTNFRQPVFQFRNAPAIPILPQPVRIALLADGRLLVSGSFTDVDSLAPADAQFGVSRFNADGTLDSTLTLDTRTGVTTWPRDVFTTASGHTCVGFRHADAGFSFDTPVPNNLARVNPDGSLDATYQPFLHTDPKAQLQSDFVAGGLVPLSGERLFVFGRKSFYGDFQYGRLLPDGSQDPAVTTDPQLASLMNQLSDIDLRATAHGEAGILFHVDDFFLAAQAMLYDLILTRVTSDGALDPSFQLPPSITDALVERNGHGGLPTRIHTNAQPLAVQADGRLYFVYGISETINRLVRLHVDGSIDESFAAVQLEPLNPTSTFPQLYDPRTGVTFQPANGVISGGSATECEVLPDGRLVIAGPFKSINGTAARGIARLHPNGTIDSSFATGEGPQWTTEPETATMRPIVEQVELDTNGQLLLAGTFEAFNGVPAPGLVRLNADGSVDTSANSPVVRNKYRGAGAILERQQDGSFLLSGPYSPPGDEDRRPALLRLLGAPQLTAAASRKTHGNAGTFEIDLLASGTTVIEPRSGGAGGTHTIVFSFNNALASGSATVTSGNGSVAGAPVIAGKTMTVTLTGVTNAQRLSVTLQGVTDVGEQVLPDTTVAVTFLLGDTTANGVVNASDVSRAKPESGQPVTASNFRLDVNVNGAINSSDLAVIKSASGTSVPVSGSEAVHR